MAAVGVGLSPLPGFGVGRRQAGDFARVVASENREAQVGAAAEQFGVRDRHVEQHLIVDGLTVEARLRRVLPADQVVENCLGDVEVVLNAGNLHRSRSDRIGAGPCVEGMRLSARICPVGS